MSANSHCDCPRHHTLFLLRSGGRSIYVYVQGKAPFYPASQRAVLHWIAGVRSQP